MTIGTRWPARAPAASSASKRSSIPPARSSAVRDTRSSSVPPRFRSTPGMNTPARCRSLAAVNSAASWLLPFPASPTTAMQDAEESSRTFEICASVLRSASSAVEIASADGSRSARRNRATSRTCRGRTAGWKVCRRSSCAMAASSLAALTTARSWADKVSRQARTRARSSVTSDGSALSPGSESAYRIDRCSACLESTARPPGRSSAMLRHRSASVATFTSGIHRSLIGASERSRERFSRSDVSTSSPKNVSRRTAASPEKRGSRSSSAQR